MNCTGLTSPCVLCFCRTSAWRLICRSSLQPIRHLSSSHSIIRSTWYVPTATRHPQRCPTPAEAANETIVFLLLHSFPHCLPLLFAEAREEERGGGEEEAVGQPGAGENSEQAAFLPRGQTLLSLLHHTHGAVGHSPLPSF